MKISGLCLTKKLNADRFCMGNMWGKLFDGR